LTGEDEGEGEKRKMVATKKKILIVDDDDEISDLIRLTLETDGYDVVRATDGIDAIEKARLHKPSLIISDVDMPRMNGMELLHELRSDPHFRLVPIIILSGSRTGPQDRISGLETGADDYVLKPFLPPELSIRVKRLIDRTEEQVSVNPLTRLPGSLTLETEVTKRIQCDVNLAVCYFDIDHFKAYNDCYGYKKGDEIIKFLAEVISHVSAAVGSCDDLLTHIGGDDFILITSKETAQNICVMAIDDFARSIPGFYSSEDIKNGYISSVNRKNEKQNLPLMTISIAIVTTENRKFEHYAQLVDVLVEIKRFAKTIKGNVWIKDRRKDS
jgi:diguanylate cyclase (GGDEF)-like protein